MSILARGLLVVAALALAGWSASQLRVEVWQDRAATQGGDEAERLLERAARATAATEPRLRLAQLALFRSQPAVARRELVIIVAREPEHAEAWKLLGQARAALGDTAGAAVARRRARALRPPVPRAATRPASAPAG